MATAMPDFRSASWRRPAALALRAAVVVTLVWQAGAAALQLGERAIGQAQVPWRQRLFDTTDDKLRRALGADAELLFALRTAVPPGSLLVTHKLGGPEDFERVQRDPSLFPVLQARKGLLVQLTTLLYPDPFFHEAPAAIEFVEDLVRRGIDALLCVLPGDRSPAGRAGWTQLVDHPGFQTWRFQKG